MKHFPYRELFFHCWLTFILGWMTYLNIESEERRNTHVSHYDIIIYIPHDPEHTIAAFKERGKWTIYDCEAALNAMDNAVRKAEDIPADVPLRLYGPNEELTACR